MSSLGREVVYAMAPPKPKLTGVSMVAEPWLTVIRSMDSFSTKRPTGLPPAGSWLPSGMPSTVMPIWTLLKMRNWTFWPYS